MSRAKIIDHYVQKINNTDFNFYDVRAELEKNNVDEEEIKMIVRIIDNEVQRRVLTRMSNNRSNELIWVGSILTTIGAGITIATYIGAERMGNSFLFVYGPILGGLSILFGGLHKRKAIHQKENSINFKTSSKFNAPRKRYSDR